MRDNMAFLEQGKPSHIIPPVKEKLLVIRAATINRKLKGEWEKMRVRRISGAKWLKHTIPLRTHFP
jgi:hypothetical protein